MGVSDRDVIDIVSLDPATGVVALTMVEARPWGERGALLPDLQAKLSTYLTYALDGQLASDYPDLRGRPVQFELAYAVAPGPREEHFLDIVRRNYLEPEGITWAQRPLPVK